MGKVRVGAAMERIGIDVMGPLTTSDKGNRFVIVICDYFTKWVEAFATPDHCAETVAKILVDHFISRWGLPSSLHSDQGREFEGKLISELCKLLGIEKTRTTPWHPSSNGLVERFNRTLGEMLRQVTGKHQKDWDEKLAVLTMAYRATVHESTGQTPNMMMLGRELPMPTHLLSKEHESEENSPNVPSYVQKIQENLWEVHDLARNHLDGAHQRQKRNFDKNVNDPKFIIGEHVWMFNPTKKKGLSPKLMMCWEEVPYKILEFLNPLVAKIKRLGSNVTRIIHIDKLKKAEGIREEDYQRKRKHQVNVFGIHVTPEIDDFERITEELGEEIKTSMLENAEKCTENEYQHECERRESIFGVHVTPKSDDLGEIMRELSEETSVKPREVRNVTLNEYLEPAWAIKTHQEGERKEKQ